MEDFDRKCHHVYVTSPGFPGRKRNGVAPTHLKTDGSLGLTQMRGVVGRGRRRFVARLLWLLTGSPRIGDNRSSDGEHGMGIQDSVVKSEASVEI